MSLGKDEPDPPPAPNPNTLVQAQQQANRINVKSPDGSATFGSPADTLTIEESPFQKTQRTRREALANILYDPATQLASGVTGNPVDFSAVPEYKFALDYQNINPRGGVPGAGGLSTEGGNAVSGNPIQYGVDPSADPRLSLEGGRANEFADYAQQGNELEQATFQRAKSLLQPDMEQGRRRLEQQLTDRGIPYSSEAGSTELNRFDRAQGEAMDRLAQSSVAAGRGEQARLFGQQLQEAGNIRANRGQLFGEDTSQAGLRNAAQNQQYQQLMSTSGLQNTQRQQDIQDQITQMNLQNTARQQGVGEQLLGNNQQLNQLQALLGVTPSFQLPNFPSPANIDVVGPYQMQYQGALNNYNQQLANNRSNLGGLFGLAGGLGSAALLGR